MTIATFCHHGRTYSVTIAGHAGYADCGPDIVCSACSVVGFAFLRYLCSADADKRLSSLTHHEVSGEMRMHARTTGDDAGVQAAWEMALGAFRMLQEQYPNNVRTIAAYDADGEK